MPQGPYLVVTDGSGNTVKGPTILKFIGAVVSRLTGNTAEITISGAGGTQLTGSGITANATAGVLPANAYLLSAFFRNTTANAVNVAIGTTSGGSDVMAATPIPAAGVGTGTLTVNPFQSPNWFSATLTKTLYLTFSGGSGYSINYQLNYNPGI